MHCARPPRGRGAASRNWFEMQFAKSSASHRRRGRLPFGMASRSGPLSNTIAFTTSPNAAKRGSLCRQRSVDCPRAVKRSASRTSAGALGALARGGREASHFGSRRRRNLTFLDRNASRDAALTWKDAIYRPGVVRILPCELRGLQNSWGYFRRPDLRKLSAVDATSFAIMKRARIRLAYAFDHHFAIIGFRSVA
jgi:hypothetical protein